MSGTFDDIIKQVMGIQAPVPKDSPMTENEMRDYLARRPFGGSPLGSMIKDWLDEYPQQSAPIAEGEMPPIDRWREATEGVVGPSQQLPFLLDQPGIGPTPIPNIGRDFDLGPRILRENDISRNRKLDI